MFLQKTKNNLAFLISLASLPSLPLANDPPNVTLTHHRCGAALLFCKVFMFNQYWFSDKHKYT